MPASSRQCSMSDAGWIAEGVGRPVSALEPDLMGPISVGETHKVVVSEFEPAVCACMSHDLNARYAVGIELIVPCRIKRVRPVHALAVAADFDHLRAAREGLAIAVACAARDASDAHGS